MRKKSVFLQNITDSAPQIERVPVGRRLAFDQNRASAGVGFPLSNGERVEVSYMQQWIANTKYKTAEINRTLLVMLVNNYK